MASQDSENSHEKEGLMLDFVEEIKSRPVIWNKQYEGHKDKISMSLAKVSSLILNVDLNLAGSGSLINWKIGASSHSL